MLKIEKHEVMGWEHVVRGMRNPMNSWEQSDSGLGCKDGYHCDDSHLCKNCGMPASAECWESKANDYIVGPNDQKLMMNLRNAGTDHRKFMRMIAVYLDITAPLYWWKEFDTYKVGTVANSCSTMHKIHAKEFETGDFSNEHMIPATLSILRSTINALNLYRWLYVNWNDIDDNTKNAHFIHEKKEAWWQMIQLLPSSYNQKRTVMLNYEVLANIYKSRKNHKLDEWHVFCDWIKSLPYSELITGENHGSDE